MPGTILLADLERANDDELRQHLGGLLNPPAPTSSDSLTNPLGTGNMVTPTVQPVAPPPELQEHLATLLAPPAVPLPDISAGMEPTTAPAPVALPDITARAEPTTAPPPVPMPSAPSNVMDELASHVQQASGGALQLMGQGMTALGSGAQAVGQGGQNVVSLVRPPAPTPAPPTPTAAAPASSDSLTNPLGLGNALPSSANPSTADVRNYIVQAAQARGIDPDTALKVAQSEGGFEAARRGTFKTGSSWWPFQLHYGGAGYEQFGDTAGMGNQFTKDTGFAPGDPRAWQAATDYALDRAKQGGWGAWYGAKAQGITGFDGINRDVPNQPGLLQGAIDRGKQLVQGAGEAVSGAVNAARGTLNQVSQFGDSQLTTSEAESACGPAAAVRFAQRYGRNPTLREATDLAATVGWTQARGMAGIGSEKALLDKMGVATKLVSGPDWGTFANEARSGNPVIISTAGHYFTADNWDPATNRFHVGRSGLDLKGGSEWMTPEQMTSVMGAVQGGLLADNPTTPASTVTTSQGFTAPAAGGTTDQQAAQVAAPQPLQIIGDTASGLGQKANEVVAGGLRFLDSAVEQASSGTMTPEAKAAAGQLSRAVPGLSALPAEQVGDVAESALKMARGPTLISDAEYAARPDAARWRELIERTDGRPATDAEVANLMRGVDTGMAAAGNEPTTRRMYHGTTGEFRTARTDLPATEGENTLGPGYYLTPEPEHASIYAQGKTGYYGDQAGAAIGGNVRPVDVPHDLQLFDLQGRQPLAPTETNAVVQAIRSIDPERANRLERLAQFVQDGQLSDRLVSPAAIWESLTSGPGALSVTDANRIIQQAGFDGIRGSFAEGTAIFDSSTSKLRNAISGTQGGEAAAPFAAGLGVAAGAGALATNLGGARDRLGEAIGGFTAPLEDLQPGGSTANAIGSTARQALTDFMGDPEEIAQSLEQNNVVGKLLRSPYQIPDAEYLARPEAQRLRDQLIAQGEEPDDARVAQRLRDLDVAQIFASHDVPGARAPKGIDYDALAALRKRQPAPVAEAVAEARTPNLADKALAFTVNNVLSNPASLLANAASGLMETVKRPVITAATAGTEALTGNLPGAKTQLGAAGADLRAMGHAVGDALAAGGETFATGRRASRAADQPEAFEGAAGMIVTPFLRGMAATDEIVHGLNSAGAQGSRIVQLMREHPQLTQAEVMAQFGDDIRAAGQHAAAESVFQIGGSGVGESLARARGKLTAPDATVGERVKAGAVQVLAPFSSVPDVLLTRGAKRIPGINELVTAPAEVIQAMRHGDPVAAKRAATSAALATMTNVAIWAEVQQGNITGNGPSDSAKRNALTQARDENGNPLWRPNSIKVGDQWVPYSSLGSVAVQIGAIANAVEQYEESGKQVDPDVARAWGTALGETISDAWYLQTVSGVFSAIQNGKLPEWAGSQALSIAGRAIPDAAMWNAFRGVADPTIREPKPKLDNPDTWLDYYANRIPGLSGTVQPKIDPATGQPMQEPRTIPGMLTRGTSSGEPSPVNELLARHNLGVSGSPRTITPAEGLTINITDEERRQFDELAGPEIEKRVVAMGNNASFQRQSPDRQRELLQGVIQDGHEVAALKLFRTLPRDEQLRRIRAYDAAQKRQAEPSVRLPE